jgi:cell shape-determining protein MreC
MEIYKQKEYDVKNMIDSVLALPSTFEDYIENVRLYIEQLENVVKDYNILKQENEQLKAELEAMKELEDVTEDDIPWLRGEEDE